MHRLNLEEFDLIYKACDIHKSYLVGFTAAETEYDKAGGTASLENRAVCVKMLRTEKSPAV